MPKPTIAKLESENLGLFIKARGLTEKLESTKKRALEQDKEIQKKDVVISSKTQRISELEKDMTSSHNALADMFLCPITKELPVDPVLAADGKIYERAKIEEWLAKHDTSPATGEKMKDTVLTAASSVVTGTIDFLLKCNAVDEQKKKTLKTKLVNEQKLKELKSKAEAGDYDAMCDLGFAYRDGQFGLAKDKKEEENWFRRSAQGRNRRGMSVYGGLLVDKGNRKGDLILGMHYLTRTATECRYSAYRIGCAYHEATLGLPKDLHQARYYLSMVGGCPERNLDYQQAGIATKLRAIQDQIDGQEQFEFGRAEHREKMRKLGAPKSKEEETEAEEDEEAEEEEAEEEEAEEEEAEEDRELEDDDKTEKANSDVDIEEQEQPRPMLKHVASPPEVPPPPVFS
mgnify:CR=1 FL=1